MPMHDTAVELRVACLTPRAVMPSKGHAADAGFDLALPADHALPPGVPYRIDLEIVLQIPHGWYGPDFRTQLGFSARPVGSSRRH